MSKQWNEERDQALIELFPVMKNAELCTLFGISERCLIKNARRLGLKKGLNKKKKMRREHVRTHFRSMSLQKIAQDIGVTKATVSRIAASLGLTRTQQEMRDFNAKHRVMLVKRERRRIIFGLEPVSDIKVVTNRKRITLRYRMKRKGYIIGAERNVMFYPPNIKRSRSQEILGESLGLKFKPLPI